jgi:hypothetical protein
MKKIYQIIFILALFNATDAAAQCNVPPPPAISNPTICAGDSALMMATDSVSIITGWYANSFGGNALATGTMFVTPNLTTTTVYYVAQLAPTGTASLSMPSQTSSFTGNVRGYFFTAPTSFMITGVRVPTDASSGNSNIAIIKLPMAPPVYSSTTSVFNVLYLTQNNTSGTGTISVNIPVYSGDIIGVLGNRNDVNSYASVSPYTATLGSYTTTLQRMGMQYNLSTTPPQAVWTETTTGASISRVELYTTLGCLNALTAATVTVNSCTTGMNELPGNSVQVGPNPTSGSLNVDLGNYNGSPVSIEVFDVIGKSVFITELTGPSHQFDISYLNNGVYFYKLSNKDGELGSGKILKQ